MDEKTGRPLFDVLADEAKPVPDLERMTKKQLVDLCWDEGFSVKYLHSRSKENLIREIRLQFRSREAGKNRRPE
jgi:hypothetical protein